MNNFDTNRVMGRLPGQRIHRQRFFGGAFHTRIVPTLQGVSDLISVLGSVKMRDMEVLW
jgi:hypothetical protein